MCPMQDVVLNPGVNSQLTDELNQAGISQSQLIRFKTGLAQKIGGWVQFYPQPVSTSPCRDIHCFQGLTNNPVVAVGSLTNLVVISSQGTLLNITPQTGQTTPSPSFSTTAGSNIVTVHDPGSSAGPYQAVRFDTYVSVGGIILSSAYAVFAPIDANSYTIAADTVATASVSSGGTLPTFTTTPSDANVLVTFPSAGFQPLLGIYYPFRAPTVLIAPSSLSAGLTIQGSYQVTSILDSTSFLINAAVESSGAVGPITMSGGTVHLNYYRTQGPPALAAPYGAGPYGTGSYGVGTPAGSGLGTTIVVTDWLLDNFGEFLTAVPKNGPLYYWSADTNYTTAQVVPTAPLFNLSGFVSQPQQIMMMIGSVQDSGTGIGLSGTQDPLLVRWSNAGDFTSWIVTTQDTAGSFRIPTGSTLIGGIQAPLFAIAWTDIDLWTATWAGQPLIWSWLRVGTGCGLIGQHACDVNQGNVYWCGPFNFYSLTANGVTVLPCSVWDFFFYQVDRANQSKVRAASNSAFNEIAWYFPLSAAACAVNGQTYTGENNAYVKLHIGEGNEFEWDYGYLARTAWVDTTVVGPPMGTDANGNILQHETSFDAAGTPINASLTTGFFIIGDGSDLALIDWILPDMVWTAFGTTALGTVNFTFFTVDYPGNPERQYGPYAVTKSTPFITTRMRGRFCRVEISSQDLGSFWRIGRIKFRYGLAGRR